MVLPALAALFAFGSAEAASAACNHGFADPAERQVNEGTGTFNVTVTRTGNPNNNNNNNGTCTVRVSTTAGTATSGVDYTAKTNETVTFAPGVLNQTVTVTVADDTLDEADETFSLGLTASPGVTTAFVNTTKPIVILDDDAPPAPVISITPSSTVDEGVGDAFFTVSIDQAPTSSYTVDLTTADGTAGSADYIGGADQAVFGPGGPQSQTFQVDVLEDTLDEPDETFTVTLSEVTGGATIGNATHTVTIEDNDVPTATLTPSTLSVTEGDTGDTNTATLTVQLDQAPQEATVVDYAVFSDTTPLAGAADTATEGTDYDGTDGSVTIPAGQTTASITVPITADTVDETDETFSVVLTSSPNAVLGAAQKSTVTITDDDTDFTVNVTTGDVSVIEGDTGTTTASVPVSLDSTAPQDVVVDYTMTNGSATAGSDYTATTGSVTIPAGQTTATISVDVLGDITDEGNEDFTVTLSNPQFSAPIRNLRADTYTLQLGAKATSSVTITDDEKILTAGGTLTFPSTQIGQTSAPQTFTITNSGDVDVAPALPYSATGANADQFLVDSSACPATLTPGASCDVTVRFAPTGEPGARVASVVAASDSPLTAPEVSLVGAAVRRSFGSSPAADGNGSDTGGNTGGGGTDGGGTDGGGTDGGGTGGTGGNGGGTDGGSQGGTGTPGGGNPGVGGASTGTAGQGGAGGAGGTLFGSGGSGGSGGSAGAPAPPVKTVLKKGLVGPTITVLANGTLQIPCEVTSGNATTCRVNVVAQVKKATSSKRLSRILVTRKLTLKNGKVVISLKLDAANRRILRRAGKKGRQVRVTVTPLDSAGRAVANYSRLSRLKIKTP